MFSEEFDKENHPLLELFADTMKREPTAPSLRRLRWSTLSRVSSSDFQTPSRAALESSHQGTTTAVLSKNRQDPKTSTYPRCAHRRRRLVVDALARLPFNLVRGTSRRRI